MNRSGSHAIVRGVAGAALIVAYEAGAHHAVSTPGLERLGLGLVLAPAGMLALGMAARSPRRALLLPLFVLAAAAVWMSRGALARHYGWGLYLEHVLFNGALGYLFGRSLAAGREPLCTQFAAMVRGRPLAPEIAAYTRRITVAWTLFFAAIVAVSTALFAKASLEAWSTFANYLTLPLAGLMFAVEHACRRIALPGVRASGMLESIRAYRRSVGPGPAGLR
ncbi:hypothetical protein WKR88_00735 [Trinickia caryophylli]|uniref:Uncharacterized membrane protein n=1 Tax=Trinickia caryophylli TaxID=28094 RepID=A0A1X7CEX7_TRICW|nr:hypothetical protein [Trinickia caryophylli]PMS12587.1 hypothetical protein C0Z17_09465 [Trinickia caryophylli]TRX19792.1 hypothetical protein FNF07_17320 [Trinickia caryophylli]WQE12879.1 hypothetical protein U0034_05630 [Trinickia caryophylli]SME95239.1 Uncharacterized membrane protein [Trinickia caryophylli]GLU30602.1 hypothetical protein Busp01_04440 [Trinickia caryophylli]